MKQKVRITYCLPCGYRPIADKFKNELEKAGAEVFLEDGERGVFDVFVNDELIFSRYQAGRFPEIGEILGKLQN